MAWSNSKIFQQAMLNPIANGAVQTTGFPTTYHGLKYDAIYAALFLTGATPDNTVSLANSLYTAGVWTTGNEAAVSGNYSAGGTQLLSPTFSIDSGSSSFVFNAANPAWTSATIASVFGCLVYNNTTTGSYAKQGYCYNYFGGTQSVTSGTFTIIWATVGATTAVFNITV